MIKTVFLSHFYDKMKRLSVFSFNIVRWTDLYKNKYLCKSVHIYILIMYNIQIIHTGYVCL